MNKLFVMMALPLVGLLSSATGCGKSSNTPSSGNGTDSALPDSGTPALDGGQEWCLSPPDYREGGVVPEGTPGAFECPEGQLCVQMGIRWMCCDPDVGNNKTWCHH